MAELPCNWNRKFGGIVAVSCDFERPGEAKTSDYLIGVPNIAGGCRTVKYIVSLSDGAVWTNFWIDNGLIVQIDRFDGNPIEL